MQDKIQEIMGLVDAAIMGAEGHEATDVVRDAIESKLRELVREPLTHDQVRQSIKEFKVANDLLGVNHMHVARAIERAHNITNTSGEA